MYELSEVIAENVEYIKRGFIDPARRGGESETVFTANNIRTGWAGTKREIMQFLEVAFIEMGFRVSRVVDWSPAYRVDMITVSW